MGKNKRAAKAARAAAAAASQQQPTSPVTPLAITAPTDSPGASNANEPAPAPTQQQHDVHAQNACPAPHAPSIASCTATTSLDGAPRSSSSSPAPSATERERHRRPAATTGDPRKAGSVDTRTAASTTSTASHTRTTTTHDVPAPQNNAAHPRIATSEPKGRREVRDGTPYDTNGADAHHSRSPASTALHTRSPTSPDVSATPSLTTRASAAENEPDGRVGAREDRAHAQPARTTPQAPPSAQRAAPSTPREAPAPAHNDKSPPTPGFEPGKPQKAAASEGHDEPALLDASHVDELVATALRKGYDTGLKEGRNVGFREGVEAGKRTGAMEGWERGFRDGKKDEREQSRLEVSTTVRVASAVQTDDISPPRVAHATSPTDYASALPCHASKSTPAPADHASPSSRLATTLDAVDSRLLQEVRGASYDRGYDAGYHDGASDTFENLEWRLDEREAEGYSRGKEDGLRTLRDEQCAARKEIETTRYWEGFGQAQQLYGARATLPAPERADAGTQTPMPPAVSCVDADAQTDAPPLRVDAASQATHDTHVDNAIDETHENHKNNSSQCDASTTTISDMHDSTSADVHHCNSSVSTVNTPTAPTSFSWADDADALPIPSAPLLPMQRDFSVLRSSTTTSPFGSLQRRARRAHRPNWRLPQRSWSRPVVEPAPVVTRRHPAGLRAGRPSVTQVSTPTSCSAALSGPLEWDHDPRLAELSRVLQGLGWVRSSIS